MFPMKHISMKSGLVAFLLLQCSFFRNSTVNGFLFLRKTGALTPEAESVSGNNEENEPSELAKEIVTHPTAKIFPDPLSYPFVKVQAVNVDRSLFPHGYTDCMESSVLRFLQAVLADYSAIRKTNFILVSFENMGIFF